MKLNFIKSIVGIILACSLTSAFAEETTPLEVIIVTASGEKVKLKETPASIAVVTREYLENQNPVNLTELMNRVPGSYIQRTGGENMLFGMRLSPRGYVMHAFAEDGIPIRGISTYSPHALSEFNWYQADKIEVVKGSTSTLFGSQAIGGVVNFQTRSAPLGFEGEVEGMVGSYGFRREAITTGTGDGRNGIRVSAVDTHSDGWREHSSYDKQAVSLRSDHLLNNGDDLTLRFTQSKYSTDQTSQMRLKEADYQNNPTLNYYGGAFDKNEAMRMSATYTHDLDSSSALSVTPYYRKIDRDSVSGISYVASPYEELVSQGSVGVMSRYHRDLDDVMKTRVTAGLDYDVSSSHYDNLAIIVKSITLPSGAKQYTNWALKPNVAKMYDFDATYTTASPYAQIEFSPITDLRLMVGYRQDTIKVDYDNHLTATKTGNIRPDSQDLSFNRGTPKIGATYQINPKTTVYANYSEGFRAPDSQMLFRPGVSQGSISLKSTVSYSKEVGLRTNVAGWFNYEATLYETILTNDILPVRDMTGVATMSAGNGKSKHTGIEMGLYTKQIARWSGYATFTYKKHEYLEWVVDRKTGENYNGNAIEFSPKTLASLGISYAPIVLNGGKVSAEVVHFGETWADPANTWKYDGYNLLNLHANYLTGKQFEIFTKIDNVMNRKYATAVSGPSTDKYFEPGLPRSVFIGAKFKF